MTINVQHTPGPWKVDKGSFQRTDGYISIVADKVGITCSSPIRRIMTLHTTFNLLKLAGACGQKPGSGLGYDKLATALGGVTQYGKNTPIPLARILETNDLDDAIWCFRATVEDYDTVVRPLLRSYLADVLEHLLLSRLTAAAKKLLAEGVALLRNTNTTKAQFQAYERTAWAAWAAAWAAWAAWAARAAWAAAWAAWAAAWAARAAGAAGAAGAARAAWAAGAAGAVEQQWQTNRFLQYLNGLPAETLAQEGDA